MLLWWLAIAFGLVGLGLFAYTVRALDAAGAVGATLLGFLLVALGGLGWLLVMVTFSGLGAVATRLGHEKKEARRILEERDGERGLRNVLANGAAAALAAVAAPIVGADVALLAFTTAVAAVTADTMGSEVGGLATRTRCILPPFEQMRPGMNGGVSWLGQAAALVGAGAIALVAVLAAGLPWTAMPVPVLAGFLGCQLDSVLGATLERDHLHDRPLSKEDVNFLASAVPTLVVLVVAAVL